MALPSTVNGVNSSRLLPKGVAYNRAVYVGVTSLSLTHTISKNCAAFGSPIGSITEISDGWYKIANDAADLDTEGDLIYKITDGGSNNLSIVDQVAAPVKLADKLAHGGTLGSSTATLALQQQHVKNASGFAVKYESNVEGLYLIGSAALYCEGAGSGANAAEFYPAATGNGFVIHGGDTSGHGIAVYANATDHALHLEQDGTGDAVAIVPGTGGEPLAFQFSGTTYTVAENARILEARLGGKTNSFSTSGGVTGHIRDIADTKNVLSITQDSNFNRTTVSINAS